MTDATRPTTPRLASLDIVRGAVMVLMALDHVRVYSGLPAGGPTPGIFFTRWVTNFCAPAFVFLAGTSAYLYGRSRPGLARFLATRGAFLILLELTVVRVSWTFNLDFGSYLLAGVIWAIGWSMLLLAIVTRLPVGVVTALGLALIAGHNLLDGRFFDLASGLSASGAGWLWTLLYFGFFGSEVRLGAGGPTLHVLYSIIPWVGVMMAGYGFGAVMTTEPARRRRACLTIGLGATALFVVLRGFDLYGDLFPWRAAAAGEAGPPMPALLAFLNATKYPASLSFLLMTLGPTIAILPLLDGARGRVARWLEVFGRVPLFFYLLHIPLIHGLALAVSVARSGAVDPWLFRNHPMANGPAPEGYAWSLALLYLVWAMAVALLYPPCRWFAEQKARSPGSFLRYL